MKELLILLALFQVKHFLCDYPLQTPYMLQKTKQTGWVLPLAAHSLIHLYGTLFILSLFAPHLSYLSIADGLIHFVVDRIKSSPNMLNRFEPDNKYFWWCLGADQMAHHLTHYGIIAAMLLN